MMYWENFEELLQVWYESTKEIEMKNLKPEPFMASAQGRVDYSVEVIPINGMMTICTESSAIYITREQAMKFFGLSDVLDPSDAISVEAIRASAELEVLVAIEREMRAIEPSMRKTNLKHGLDLVPNFAESIMNRKPQISIEQYANCNKIATMFGNGFPKTCKECGCGPCKISKL